MQTNFHAHSEKFIPTKIGFANSIKRESQTGCQIALPGHLITHIPQLIWTEFRIFASMRGKDNEGEQERMQPPESYVNERLDHLGLVAGVCQEIGLAGYLDRLAGETKQHVSIGMATVAMILNGL